MDVNAHQQRRLLVSFCTAVCQLYIDELHYVKVNRKLVELHYTLSSKQLRDLGKILNKHDQLQLFRASEDLARYHVHYILPEIRSMFNKLPSVIQELTKMALRQKSLYTDQIAPPGTDFNLLYEIQRYAFVETSESITDGELEIYEAEQSDPNVQFTRNSRSAAMLDAVESIYDSHTLHALMQRGFTDEFGELVWRTRTIKLELQQSEQAALLNQFFSDSMPQGFLAQYDYLYQYHYQMSYAFKILAQAVAQLGELVAESSLELAENLYNSSQIPLNRITELEQFYQEAKVVTDPNIKQRANTELAKVQARYEQKPLVLPDIKILIRNLANKDIIKNWQLNFNVTKFKERFSDNQYIFKDEKDPKIKILSTYGIALVKAQIAKCRGEASPCVALYICEENIRDEADFREAKILLMGFAACFNPELFSDIKIRCNLPEVTKELTMLALQNEIKHVVLEEATAINITKYGVQDPDTLLLTIEPQVRNLLHQTQNILDLGFIPELTSESQETLRIKSMSHVNLTNEKMAPGLALHISHQNPVIATEQIKACFACGFSITVAEEAQRSIHQYWPRDQEVPTIKIRALTYYDLAKRLQLVLHLGLLPKITDMHSKELLNRKILEHYEHAHTMQNLLIDIPDPEIAYEQLLKLMRQGIPSKFTNMKLADGVYKYLGKQDNHIVTVDFDSPQAAIDAATYLAKCNLNFSFSHQTRTKVINFLVQFAKDKPLPAANYTQPVYIDFKRTLENCMLINLNRNALNSITKDILEITKNDDVILNINFSGYTANAHNLLIKQVEQIETINQQLSKPIRYFCDSITEEHNSLAIVKYLQLEIQQFINLHIQHILDAVATMEKHEEKLMMLVKSLRTIADHVSMSPMSKLAALETNMMNNQYNIDDLPQLLHPLLQDLPRLQRKVHGLCFNANKTTFLNADRRRKYKYIQLAEKYAHNIQEQLFQRARDLTTNKNKSNNQIIDIPALAANIISPESTTYDEIKLIHRTSALQLAEVEKLSQGAIFERLHILGRRIAEGLVLDAGLQEELKALSSKVASSGPLFITGSDQLN